MSPTGERNSWELGFTLIEVVVVLAILALVTAVAIPYLSRGNASLNSAAATQEIAASLRLARNTAMLRARSEVFTLDTARGVYRADSSDSPHRLPKGLRLALVTTAAERLSPTVGHIRFYADGSSDGGGVLLSEGNTRTEILVNWLTGSVSIEKETDAAHR